MSKEDPVKGEVCDLKHQSLEDKISANERNLQRLEKATGKLYAMLWTVILMEVPILGAIISKLVTK